jgi:hypothetical protein
MKQDYSLDACKDADYPPEDEEFLEIPMTLCIAAIAEEEGDPRIVLCADWKSTSNLGATETADKMKWLQKPRWVVMRAGVSSHSTRMIRSFKAFFRDKEITDVNAADLIEEAVYEHARKLRERYSQMTMGMSYEKLQKWAVAAPQLGPVQEALGEIKKLRAECSLIIAGFTKSDKPVICKIRQTASPPFHEITIEDHFAAIGEGSGIATPSLYRREYDCNVPLEKAIYQIYEAKVLAETVSSVGDATSVDILYPKGRAASVNTKGHLYLEGLLKKYGPKPKIRKVNWERRYTGRLSLD